MLASLGGPAVSYQRLCVTLLRVKCGVERLLELQLLHCLLTGHGVASLGLHSTSTSPTTPRVSFCFSVLKLDAPLAPQRQRHRAVSFWCFPDFRMYFLPGGNLRANVKADGERWRRRGRKSRGCRLGPTSQLPLPLFAKHRVRRHALCTGLHTHTHTLW